MKEASLALNGGWNKPDCACICQWRDTLLETLHRGEKKRRRQGQHTTIEQASLCHMLEDLHHGLRSDDVSPHYSRIEHGGMQLQAVRARRRSEPSVLYIVMNAFHPPEYSL